MNLPYNHLHEIHRFAQATDEAKKYAEGRDEDDAAAHTFLPPPDLREEQARRFRWAQDNADIVVFLHALRVELLVEMVMKYLVPETDAAPFQYWLRFEFGSSGNPHAHGLNYVHGNPAFECVVEDAAQKEQLKKSQYPGAEDFQTKDEAEQALANFYCDYVRESHPAKDEQGDRLYDFLIENLMLPGEDKPQSRNLLPMLEKIFADPDQDPDLREIKNLLLALIEDGNRHTWHSHREGPVWGVDPCARKAKKPGRPEEVYCRYLFSRDLYV